MDKDEEKDREVKDEETTAILEKVALPVAPEYTKAIKDVLEAMDKSRAAMFSLIKKDAKSMFRNKRALNYIAQLNEYVYHVTRISVIAYFSDDYLNRRLDVLDEVIGILIQEIVALPQPEDVKELREFSKQRTQLEALMKKLKELEDEATSEKANTFKKLDKARQQLLDQGLV